MAESIHYEEILQAPQCPVSLQGLFPMFPAATNSCLEQLSMGITSYMVYAQSQVNVLGVAGLPPSITDLLDLKALD